MTADTLNPIADLAELIPSGSAALSFAEAATETPFDLAPKKPSYGYDEPSEDDDGYDDEEDELDEDDDEEDDVDEEDDDYSYDDDEEEEEDEEEDEDEDDDDEEDDEDEEDDDIGYYTRSPNASQNSRLSSALPQ